jgi:hypothetical protein
VSPRSHGGVAGGEEAVATAAGELRGADDEFDGLRPNGEILDGGGVVVAVDRVASDPTVRTGRDLVGRHDGKTDGIAGSIPALVDYAKLGKVERLGPKGKMVSLAHLLLLTPSSS